MNPRPGFVVAAAIAVLAFVATAHAAGDKSLPPSVGGPAPTSTSVSTSDVRASRGPKSAAARKKSGSASRVVSSATAASRDARLSEKFVACRDARGGPSQRACEADYATFVAGNFR